MTPPIILRDTREKKPWEFEDFDVHTRDETINTGDYTFGELCSHDGDKNTYYPRYAVERKTGGDFVGSITKNRDRFEAEIKRASDWDSPLLVIVETPKEPSRYQDNIFKYHEITRENAFATVDNWERQHNVSFRFSGNRERGEQIAYETLLTRRRAFRNSSE